MSNAAKNILKLQDLLSVKDFGAVGDGVADDTAALQSAANSGQRVVLDDAVYLISSAILMTSGSGFVCPSGCAVLMAKTGIGGFNVTNVNAPRTGTDRNMIICDTIDDVELQGIYFITDNNNVSPNEIYLNGIRVTGGMNSEGYCFSRLSFKNFNAGSMVIINSAGAGRRRYVQIEGVSNCAVTQGATYWTGTPQLTVVEVDNDRVAGAASVGGVVRIDSIRDLLFTGTALTDYGCQTDGVTLAGVTGNKTSGWDIEIGTVKGCGEVIDCFGESNTVRIGHVENINNDVIKLIHGAQNNHISLGTALNTGRSVVALSGSATTDQDIQYNSVHVGSVMLPGTYGSLIGGETCVVLGISSTATYKPKNNVVDIGSVVGDGVNLDYVVKDGSGAAASDLGNEVIIRKATGYAIGSVSAPAKNLRVRCLSRSYSKACLSAAQTLTSGSTFTLALNETVADLEGIVDLANDKIRVEWPGLYHVECSIRFDNEMVGTSDDVALTLLKNTTIIEQRNYRMNLAVGIETFTLSAIVKIDEEDIVSAGVRSAASDLYFKIRQDTGADADIVDANHMTYFALSRIG